MKKLNFYHVVNGNLKGKWSIIFESIIVCVWCKNTNILSPMRKLWDFFKIIEQLSGVNIKEIKWIYIEIIYG